MKSRWYKALLFALPGVALAAALAVLPGQARAADDYPNQNIRFICAFPAGSGADVIVRYFAEKVRPIAGQTIIVENKVGAAGNIAAEYVARSEPDGYTILVHAASGLAANMHVFKTPPIDATRDLQVAATINDQAFMLVVAENSPYKTVEDLTAAMKEKGAAASYAYSNNVGRTMGELYKIGAELETVGVAYKTAPESLNDILSGAIDYGALDPEFSIAQTRAGKLRILAVSSGHRMSALPDIPTMAESGVPDMDLVGGFEAIVPSATPKPIVDTINGWFEQVLKTPEAEKFLSGFGTDVLISTPEEGQALFERDVEIWGKYVELAKIPKH